MPYKDPEIRRIKGNERSAKYRANLSPEKREMFRAKNREAARKRWTALSKAEKDRHGAEKVRRYRLNPGPRRIKQRGYTAKYFSNFTPEKWAEHYARQRAAKRDWWAALPEIKKKAIIEKKRQDYHLNPKVRERRYRRAKVYYKQLRRTVLEKLGNRCSSPDCGWINPDGTKGCTDTRCLQIDHVRGGGTKEYRSKSNSAVLWTVLADMTGSYQCLCANCNWIKRFTNKEFSKGQTTKRPVLVPPAVPSGLSPASR